VGYEAVAKMQRGVTKALVNTALVMPADFTRNAGPRISTRLDGAGDPRRKLPRAMPNSSMRPGSPPA